MMNLKTMAVRMAAALTSRMMTSTRTILVVHHVCSLESEEEAVEEEHCTTVTN